MKSYEIKVYTKAGDYITSWKDVISDIKFTNEINSAGGQMSLKLGRNAGDYGEGTDVDFGYRVKVYCIDVEAPEGILIFQGYISSYTPIYKDSSVDIMLLSYGAELNDYIIEAGETNIITQDTQTTGWSFGNYASAFNTQNVGQSFVTVGTGSINRVEFILSYGNSGDVNVGTRVSLFTGLVGGAGTFLTSSNVVTVNSASLETYSFVFNPEYEYTDGTNLHFELSTTQAYFPGSDKYPLFIRSAGSNVYAGGKILYSYNS